VARASCAPHVGRKAAHDAGDGAEALAGDAAVDLDERLALGRRVGAVDHDARGVDELEPDPVSMHADRRALDDAHHQRCPAGSSRSRTVSMSGKRASAACTSAAVDERERRAEHVVERACTDRPDALRALDAHVAQGHERASTRRCRPRRRRRARATDGHGTT
jgi:hypothetical protein